VGYYRDLREYLQVLNEAGKLRVVREQINKDTELHPLVRWQFRGLEESQRTGWLFENLTDLAFMDFLRFALQAESINFLICA
jgi:3-polyprenyl-4-hydroxybenzoate decarboxylase